MYRGNVISCQAPWNERIYCTSAWRSPEKNTWDSPSMRSRECGGPLSFLCRRSHLSSACGLKGLWFRALEKLPSGPVAKTSRARVLGSLRS